MKKISLLVALAIILAVAAPVFANSYSDVPTNHWAYEALNKVAAAGIVTGYQDGTFRGKNTLTRYEIAIIVSRILDKVAAERALLAEKVDALENGLTAGQAEDTIAIFRSLLAKERDRMITDLKANENKTDATVVLPESLTEAQAAEVAAIVEALSMEFKFELEAMGARLDAIEGQVADVEGRLEGVEGRLADVEGRATITGKYSVNVKRYAAEGAGTPYFDPFNKDNDESENYNAAGDPVYDMFYDFYAPSYNRIENKVTLGVDVQKGDLTADLDIVAFRDRFDGNFVSDAYTTWYFLNGVVTSGEFEAVIGHEQELLMKPYLFNLSSSYYNGVIATIGDDQFAFVKKQVEYGEDNTPIYVTAKKGLGLLDTTLYVGMSDVINSNNFVAALATPQDLLTVDLNTEVAIEGSNMDHYKYFSIDAKKALGPLTVAGSYTLRDADFAGIESYAIRKAGYTGNVDVELFDGKVTANGRYKNYTPWEGGKLYDTRFGFGTEVAFGPITASYDKDFATKEGLDDSSREQRSVEFDQKVAFLTLNAGYEYDNYTDNLGTLYGDWYDEYYEAASTYNNVHGKVTMDLFIPGLTANVKVTKSLSDIDSYKQWFGEKWGLSVVTPGVNFKKGIFEANYNYELVRERMTYGVKVNPEAFTVLGFSIDTEAGVTMRNYMDTTKTDLYDYNVGLDVKKALNEKSNVTYSFVYDNRDRYLSDNALTGLKVQHVGTIDYAISDNLTAKVTYTNLDFTGKVDADSYKVQELKTGLSLSF